MRAAGIDSADLDARLLVGAACGLDHVGLVREGSRGLGDHATEQLRASISRRIAREPVSRILGLREFWGLTFAIGPGVLDPRPETEGVVAVVLDGLNGRECEPLRILDLGTGSGAILIALLHELPGAFGVGVDRSADACRIAAANITARGLGERAALLRGSWAEALVGRFDVIVSNPPYIASDEIAGLEPDVARYDPHVALDGGQDGLDAYRALLPRASQLLSSNGIIALECGWDQGEAVASLCDGNDLHTVRIVPDLAGHGRVIAARACASPRRARSP